MSIHYPVFVCLSLVILYLGLCLLSSSSFPDTITDTHNQTDTQALNDTDYNIESNFFLPPYLPLSLPPPPGLPNPSPNPTLPYPSLPPSPSPTLLFSPSSSSNPSLTPSLAPTTSYPLCTRVYLLTSH